jgi:hypothetical protein
MLFVLVVGYELGPARWLNDRLGTTVHFLAEIIVYGTVGPILAYLLLDFFSRWMAERETSDLQAKMLAEAHLHAQRRFVQNDDVLQDLFAASVILNSLQERSEELPPDVARQVAEAKRAVGDTLQHVIVKSPVGAPGLTFLSKRIRGHPRQTAVLAPKYSSPDLAAMRCGESRGWRARSR